MQGSHGDQHPADFERDRVDEFKRFTERKLRGLRCPEHRQPPRVRFHGARLRDITISLTGCCPRLMKLANEAVAARDV
ncbi:MAG: hypothetical protein ACR2NN_03715 [Bryobacteraceae bacterium]